MLIFYLLNTKTFSCW